LLILLGRVLKRLFFLGAQSAPNGSHYAVPLIVGNVLRTPYKFIVMYDVNTTIIKLTSVRFRSDASGGTAVYASLPPLELAERERRASLQKKLYALTGCFGPMTASSAVACSSQQSRDT
jgi:hypothetical protein